MEEDKVPNIVVCPEMQESKSKLVKVCANIFLIVSVLCVLVLLAAGTLKLTLWILGS